MRRLKTTGLSLTLPALAVAPSDDVELLVRLLGNLSG
jgi:hypothetical protein